MNSKPECIIDGCHRPQLARRLCSADYQRAKANGTLDEISPRPHTICEQCGEPIPPSRRWGAQYCSRTCKDAAMDAAKHAALLASRETRARFCAWCKEPLTADHRFGTRFCSRPCGDAWSNHQRALSARRAKLAARRPCEVCGGPIPDSRAANAIYCSPECKRLSRRSISPRAQRVQKDSNLRYLYGITPEQWLVVLETQSGVCAICGLDTWPGKDNSPHTDHDPGTKRFRGILCGNCNNGIGMLGEDPFRLIAAAWYLLTATVNPAGLGYPYSDPALLRGAVTAYIEASAMT